MLLKGWAILTTLLPHTLFRSHPQSPHLIFQSGWILSFPSPVHHSQFSSPSTETLWLWQPKTVKRNLSELLEYSKISWQSHLCKGLDDLKQNWRVMPHEMLRSWSKYLSSANFEGLSEALKKSAQKNLGFDFFLFPSLPVLCSYILNRFLLVLWKLLGAKGEPLP